MTLWMVFCHHQLRHIAYNSTELRLLRIWKARLMFVCWARDWLTFKCCGQKNVHRSIESRSFKSVCSSNTLRRTSSQKAQDRFACGFVAFRYKAGCTVQTQDNNVFFIKQQFLTDRSFVLKQVSCPIWATLSFLRQSQTELQWLKTNSQKSIESAIVNVAFLPTRQTQDRISSGSS